MTSQLWTPYCGAAPLPAELLGRWNLDPPLLGALAIGIFGYARFVRAGSPRERRCFAAALGLLALLFLSPFCALTSALFSARVIHHVLLAAVAAPLLVAALPRSAVPLRRGLVAATIIHAAVFWLWHAPPAYAWALSGDAAYWLMQATLLASACAFWAAVRNAPPLAAAGALLGTMVQMGLLGALITFAPAPLYAPHLASTAAWGFAPLDDQQLAGLVMWAPAAALYLCAALAVIGRWLGPDPAQARPA